MYALGSHSDSLEISWHLDSETGAVLLAFSPIVEVHGSQRDSHEFPVPTSPPRQKTAPTALLPSAH